MMAGLPDTTALWGTWRVTTAPGATTAFSPTVMPGRMVALAPMETPRLTAVQVRESGGRPQPFCWASALAKAELVPMKTSSSMRTPAQT